MLERLRASRENLESQQQFLAMYSSVFGGITTDPAAMVIPIDDHMVHRGHGVFDTAAIVDGYVRFYFIQFDQDSDVDLAQDPHNSHFKLMGFHDSLNFSKT